MIEAATAAALSSTALCWWAGDTDRRTETGGRTDQWTSGGGEPKTSQRMATAFPSTAEYSSWSGVRTTGARSAERWFGKKTRLTRFTTFTRFTVPLFPPPSSKISFYAPPTHRSRGKGAVGGARVRAWPVGGAREQGEANSTENRPRNLLSNPAVFLLKVTSCVHAIVQIANNSAEKNNSTDTVDTKFESQS